MHKICHLKERWYNMTDSELNIINWIDKGFKPAHIMRYFGKTRREIIQACSYVNLDINLFVETLTEELVLKHRSEGMKFNEIAHIYEISAAEVILLYRDALRNSNAIAEPAKEEMRLDTSVVFKMMP